MYAHVNAGNPGGKGWSAEMVVSPVGFDSQTEILYKSGTGLSCCNILSSPQSLTSDFFREPLRYQCFGF